MSKIVIAIPRGRIIKELKTMLNKTSFAPENEMFNEKSRKLTFLSKNKNVNFIKVRAFDACTFVAFGAAQIGIAGEDVIMIQTVNKRVFVLLEMVKHQLHQFQVVFLEVAMIIQILIH